MTDRGNRGNRENPADLENLLRDAFDAEARSRVGEFAAVPPPSFPMTTTDAASVTFAITDAAAHVERRWRPVRVLAPLAAAAAVVAAVTVSVVLTRHTAGTTTAGRPQAAAAALTGTTLSQTLPTVRHDAVGAPVVLTLPPIAAPTVGTGLPVVTHFSRRFTDARSLTAATTVTVDGRAVAAAWFFEPAADGRPGVDGHLRTAGRWPAFARVTIDVASRHVTAGPGLRFVNAVHASFRTGATVTAVVDARHDVLRLRRDGRLTNVYPVSLGARSTPTTRGIKVVMAKRTLGRLTDPAGTYDEKVRWLQELTYSGEYLHAAPWAGSELGRHNVSDGCTWLSTPDARRLYRQLSVGDLVEFPNANGPAMTAGAGLGDWNVPWSTWRRGGLIRTT